MDINEKALYHQVHPLKFWTDWVSGAIALYFLWQHNLLLGLLIALVPPTIVSWIILSQINLDRLKYSYWGKYTKKYMTREYQILRLFGYIFMIFSVWFHSIILSFVGLGIILYAWFHGLLYKFR